MQDTLFTIILLLDIIVECFVCRLIYIWTILLLRLMQIKCSQHKKYAAKYVHMYNFSRFCYIVTDNVLSGNTITQDA